MDEDRIGNALYQGSGSSGNTYSGLTTVNGGIVRLAKTPGNAVPGDLTIASGTVFLDNNNQIGDAAVLTVGPGATIQFLIFTDTIGQLIAQNNAAVNGQNPVTISGAATTYLGDSSSVPVRLIGGTGDVELHDDVSCFAFGLTLNGRLTYVGANTFSVVSGDVNLNGAVREIAVNDGADWRDLQIFGIISNGGITKTGNGVLRLQGVNAYSGPTTVSAGVLELNSLGQIDVNSAITNNAEFRIDGGTHTVGTISGIGTTRLINGGELTVASLVQGTLEIGARLSAYYSTLGRRPRSRNRWKSPLRSRTDDAMPVDRGGGCLLFSFGKSRFLQIYRTQSRKSHLN